MSFHGSIRAGRRGRFCRKAWSPERRAKGGEAKGHALIFTQASGHNGSRCQILPSVLKLDLEAGEPEGTTTLPTPGSQGSS